MIYALFYYARCRSRGTGPGCSIQRKTEKDDTLALTLAIGEILQNRGVDVEYTRTTDVYETPYQKAMEANEAGADFFISIHRNSYPLTTRFPCGISRI